MLKFEETGALCFGIVVGWVAYRTLRRSSGSGLSDIATVIGAVGGASVTGLFPATTALFAAYCIGLALGFFGYLLTAIVLTPRGEKVNEWLGAGPDDPRAHDPRGGGGGGGGVSRNQEPAPDFPKR